jgi:tetratricopeptide (TPR) repeat protein
VLGDLGRVLVLSSDPALRAQKITLTPADGFVLSRIDGSSSARDVMALVPLPSDDVERSLFGLLCTGIVDYRRETPSASRAGSRTEARAAARSKPATEAGSTPMPAAATNATPTPAPATSATPTPSQATTPPFTPAPPTPTPRPERNVDELRALILSLHDRLRLDHFEVLGLERSATEAEIRETYAGYARILHPDACLDPALDDLREKREAVFIRLSAAHETLRHADSRASYERAFEPSKLRFPRPVPPPPQPTPPPAAASPAPVPQPAAAPEPERPTFDPRLLPESILATADELFRQEAYWEAIQQLEPMIPRATGETRESAQLLLAQAYLKNPKWTRRAEGVLQALLAKNPRHVPAQLQLAEIYRASGLLSRARAAYEKVLEIEPDNVLASRALDFLEPKANEPRQSGLASLFRRR